MLNCEECDGEINLLEDASTGEIVSCPDCGADFEIASDGTLKHAESIGEDWGQ